MAFVTRVCPWRLSFSFFSFSNILVLWRMEAPGKRVPGHSLGPGCKWCLLRPERVPASSHWLSQAREEHTHYKGRQWQGAGCVPRWSSVGRDSRLWRGSPTGRAAWQSCWGCNRKRDGAHCLPARRHRCAQLVSIPSFPRAYEGVSVHCQPGFNDLAQ